MAINKVVFGGRTLVDLTADTVSPDSLLSGYTAHAADGSSIIGTAIPIKVSSTQPEGHGFLWVKPFCVDGVYSPDTEATSISFASAPTITLDFVSDANNVIASSVYTYTLEFYVTATSATSNVTFNSFITKGNKSVILGETSSVSFSANQTRKLTLSVSSDTRLNTNSEAISVAIKAVANSVAALSLVIDQTKLTITGADENATTACGIYYVS